MDNENDKTSDYVPEDDSDDTASISDNSLSSIKKAKQIVNSIANQINTNCNEDDYVNILVEMFEWIQEYIDQEILRVSSPDFYKTLVTDIASIFYDYWLDAELCNEDDYDDIEDLVDNVVDLFFDFSNVVPRSQKYESIQPIILSDTDIETLKQKLQHLKQIPQPAQRTQEWYEFRNTLITASNIWKVFSSQANQNSLIYEKCKPVQLNVAAAAPTQINTTNALHWGVKYEPLSVMVYEDMFQSSISDYGCIPHEKYNFIGASPDGINMDETNKVRYGRMLEIKNIYNREITGIPKEEYWIQTQLQMETCDLDMCDFFETRFKEFESKEAFYADTEHEYKGVILYFIQKTGGYGIDISNSQVYSNVPKYVYMPLSIEKTETEIQAWISQVREEMRSEYTLYSTLYWYLHEFSCVLIQRNRAWFSAALPKIRELWDIVLKERVDGYEHRAAKKQKSKQKDANQLVTVENNIENNTQIIRNMPTKKPICLVKLDA